MAPPQISESQCVAILANFTNAPPKTIRFTPISSCIYDVTKVQVRICSRTNALDWDYLFIHYSGEWHLAGGSRLTRTLARRTFTGLEVAKYLCKALKARQSDARLEVDITFRERSPHCNPIDWSPAIDTRIIRATKASNPSKPGVVMFDRQSTFPPLAFEYDGVQLKYIFDFMSRKPISIWSPEEMDFQEAGQSIHRQYWKN